MFCSDNYGSKIGVDNGFDNLSRPALRKLKLAQYSPRTVKLSLLAGALVFAVIAFLLLTDVPEFVVLNTEPGDTNILARWIVGAVFVFMAGCAITAAWMTLNNDHPTPADTATDREFDEVFQTLIDSIPTPLVYKGRDHVLLTCNKAYTTAIGLERDKIIGATALELLPDPLAKAYHASDEEVMSSGDSAVVETTFPYVNHGMRAVNVHKNVVRNRDSEIVGLVAVITDVTEQREFEAELIRAKEVAEFSDRAKSEFLANMSHELRTPLNAIIGFSQVISDELFGPITIPRYREYASDINFSGQHLLAIIGDLLDISKIEAGELELLSEWLDIESEIGVCVSMIEDRAKRSNVNIVLDIEDGLPQIFADSTRLRQIVLNLLSNAVKFSDADSDILLAANRDDDGNLSLVIKDTGIGMAPEDIPKALEPFQQIGSRQSVSNEGTGLGLALVKRLVELHDGRLEVESKLREGTVVTVTFPLPTPSNITVPGGS